MAERLTELVRLAVRLACDAQPARARVLEYLRLVPLADLSRMQPVPQSDDPAIRRVADQLGDEPELIQHVLAEFFRLDLPDYSAEYSAALRFYLTSGQLAQEARAYLAEAFPAPHILYLLHGSLSGWEPQTLDASEGIIIEGMDYGEEDDRFCEAIDGYLVSRGMAFGSEVEMLAASFYDEWPCWYVLWDRYFGWSDLD